MATVRTRKGKQTIKGEDGFCAYVGPTIRGVIQHGTIFKGTKSDAINAPELAAAIRQQPLIKGLIVNGKALPDAMIKIKSRGNLLYMKYQQLQSAGAEEESKW